MRRYSAKILLISILLIISTSVYAQRFGLSVSTGLFYSGSTISGFIDTASWTVDRAGFHEFAMNYVGARGLFCILGVGIQKEEFHLTEIVKSQQWQGLRIGKQYKSFPISFSLGYMRQISTLPRYHIFGNVSLGVANVNSNNADSELGNDIISYNQQAMSNDTIHHLEITVDDSREQILLQYRLVLGAEYRADHFFIRSYGEFRTWADYFGQLSYLSEYSSTLYNESYNRSGSFRLRTAYVGIVFSAGFYFPEAKSEE